MSGTLDKEENNKTNSIKVFDCFTFYNELKMLNFRLHELDEYVDYFVLVEANKTHSGNDKPLFFELNKEKYGKFLHKIIHIVVDDFPETDNAWVRENYQRNAISRGFLKVKPSPEDIIIISDCDEVLDPINITEFKKRKLKGIYQFYQDLYYYNLNTKIINRTKGYRPKIMDYETFTNLKGPESARKKNPSSMGGVTGVRGGWHFSFFGETDSIINKIQNFAHQEYNNEKILNQERINEKIKNNEDIFERGYTFKYIKIEDNDYLPKNYKLLL